MNFARLTATGQGIAARILGRTAGGALVSAWFPPDAKSKPSTVTGFTLAAGPVTIGPVRLQQGEVFGLTSREESLVAVSVNGVLLAWDPAPGITTFLAGTTAAAAQRYLVTTFRRAAGLVEIEAKVMPALPVVA